jgi:hypothetical protein
MGQQDFQEHCTPIPFPTLLPAAFLHHGLIPPAHASLRDVMRKIGNGLWSLNVERLNLELP